MSIQTDHSGRRFISAAVKVPGAAREIWQAVASSPGISSWFVPTELQLGPDGRPSRLESYIAHRTSLAANITEWKPPERFRTVSDELGPRAPLLTTLWTLEALSGSACRVQVQQSVDTKLLDWDAALLLKRQRWSQFLGILKLYLANFAGKRCSTCSMVTTTSQPHHKAWEALAEPLGLTNAAAGDRCKSEADAPLLAGIVESAEVGAHPHQVLLRLDQPAQGIAHLVATPVANQLCLSVRLYFYGDQAAVTVSREEPTWQSWLSQLFTTSGSY